MYRNVAPDGGRPVSEWRKNVISPRLGEMSKRHWGLGIVCADCGHLVVYRSIGIQTQFKRWLNLSLIQFEEKCRCEPCGSKNVRCYPWSGGP